MTCHCLKEVVLIISTCIYMFPICVLGRQLYVSHTGRDMHTCGDHAKPCRSLRYAVSKSTAYDTVYLDGSKSPYNECADSFMTISWTLTITAYNAPNAVIDCQNQHSKLFNITGVKYHTKALHFSLDSIVLISCTGSNIRGSIALANAYLVLRNSVFRDSGLVLFNPGRECVGSFLLIQNCSFEGNVHKHLYQPGILLKDCRQIVLNVDNVTMKASPMRVQADSGMMLTINRLHAVGDFGGRKIITSLVDVSLGKDTNQVVIANSRFSDHKRSTQSSLTIRVFENITNPSSIHLTNVSFVNITESQTDGSALSILTVMPSKSSLGNKKLKLKVSYCEFSDNSAAASYYGGAIYLEKISMIKFNQCQFRKNNATNGGVFSIRRGSNISLSNCELNNNKARHPNSIYYPSHGGAMFINDADVTIFNSTFSDNRAEASGSAIYLTRGASINVLSSLISGDSSGFSSIMHTSGGDCSANDKDSSIMGSTIRISRDGNGEKCTHVRLTNTDVKNTEFVCPVGYGFYQLSQPSTVLVEGRYNELLISCRSCEDGKYSLQRGSSSNSTFCSTCPPYGDCHDGILRAKANFWISVDDVSNASLVRCPVGYCCAGGGCDVDKTCEGSRQGRLCGQCRAGHTIPINHNSCVPINTCNSMGLWLSIAFSTLAYAFVIIVFSEIAYLFLKLISPIQLLLRQCRKKQRGEDSEPNLNSDPQREPSSSFADDTPILHNMEDAAVINDRITHISTTSTEEESNMNKPQSNLDDDPVNDHVVFTGGVRLLFHLYQISPLFYLTFTSSPKNFHPALDSINAFFHFLPIFYTGNHSDNMCPDFILSFTTKQLVETISVIATPLVIVLLYFLIWFIMWTSSIFQCRNYSRSLSKLHVRFVSAFVHAIIITYISVALLTFKLTSCVKVGDEKVMFFDGSIVCGRWWHLVLLAFAAVHLFPLLLTFLIGPPLLARSKISLRVFVCSCLIPAPMAIYLCLTLLREHQAKRSHQDPHPQAHSPAAREVLKIMCQSFAKSDAGSEGKCAYRISCNYHEAIWLIAKLVFVLFYSTLSYKPLLCALAQLVWFSMVVCGLLVTAGHSNRILRGLELLCIIILSILITLNLVPAAFYDNGTKPSDFGKALSFLWPTISTGILIILLAFIVTAAIMHVFGCLSRCFKPKT